MEIKKEIAEGEGLPGFSLFFLKRQHDFAKNKPNRFKLKTNHGPSRLNKLRIIQVKNKVPCCDSASGLSRKFNALSDQIFLILTKIWSSQRIS